MTDEDFNPDNILKNMSAQDFLNLGIQDIAYIKPVDVEDGTAYAICAADGTTLSVMDTMSTAVTAARQNDLEPVTLH